MEIARLKVSTMKHMQETAKKNCAQYGRNKKKKKPGKFPHAAASGGGSSSKHSGKDGKLPLPTNICWRCEKGRHQKGQVCKAVDVVLSVMVKSSVCVFDHALRNAVSRICQDIFSLVVM